jgi:hypothetical protein
VACWHRGLHSLAAATTLMQRLIPPATTLGHTSPTASMAAAPPHSLPLRSALSRAWAGERGDGIG